MLNMSINLTQEKCPNCGAPLKDLNATVVVCSFCSAELQKASLPSFRIPSALPPTRPSADLGRVSVGNTSYRVHGRLAQGECCDVFLARRDSLLTEMVILKIARDDAGPLKREHAVLADLRKRAEGTFLEVMLPQAVGLGVARCDGKPEHTAAVYRWRSGFDFTFEDARAEYPGGVDPRACVWMWNRLLEQLSQLHKLGYSHRAIAPAHLLIHPRDHGLVLCGWSRCTPGPGDDLPRSAECIGFLLGSGAPRVLTDLVKRAPKYREALELKTELKRVAQEAFGPPRFHPFVLTGNTKGGLHGIRQL